MLAAGADVSQKSQQRDFVPRQLFATSPSCLREKQTKGDEKLFVESVRKAASKKAQPVPKQRMLQLAAERQNKSLRCDSQWQAEQVNRMRQKFYYLQRIKPIEDKKRLSVQSASTK